MTREQAKKFISDLVTLRTGVSDDIAVTVSNVYPEWTAGMVLEKDARIRHGGKFYRVLEDHTADENYSPDITNYRYVEIADPGLEYPEWVQPTGYTDAYSYGDKVSHNGSKWISTVEGDYSNTWEPGVYGWEIVQE